MKLYRAFRTPFLIAAALAIICGGPSFAQGLSEADTTVNPFAKPGQKVAQNSPAAEKPVEKTKKPKAADTLKPGQFGNEAEAKAKCPGDAVVWVNTSSKIYHYAGNSGYGKTKRGAYMCERETAAAGFRAAKNEKRKG